MTSSKLMAFIFSLSSNGEMWSFYLIQAIVQLIQHSEGYGLYPVSVKLLCRQSHLVCSFIPIRFGLIVILLKSIEHRFSLDPRRKSAAVVVVVIPVIRYVYVRICKTLVDATSISGRPSLSRY